MAASPTLLVPSQAMPHLGERLADQGAVATYEPGRVDLADRLLAKAGLKTPSDTAQTKFRGLEKVGLDAVRALWVDATLDLSGPEAEAVVARLPSLEWVFWQRAGLDGVPLAAFHDRGIEVEGAGPLTSRWVAETNVACILAEAKRIASSARSAPLRPVPFTRPLTELTIAIVGTGRIGQATAELCRSLGMTTWGMSRRPDQIGTEGPFDEVRAVSALATNIAGADFLVLAVPLTPSTAGMVDDAVLAALGRGGTVVNLARPRVVDQPALVRRLRAGALGAAYVSRLDDGLSPMARRRAAREPRLYQTYNLEGHTAAKLGVAADLFVAGLRSRELLG